MGSGDVTAMVGTDVGSGTGAWEAGTGAREVGTGAREAGTGAWEAGTRAWDVGEGRRAGSREAADPETDPDAIDPAFCIRISPCISEGVVGVSCADNESMSSTSSMGTGSSTGVVGVTERVVGRGTGESRMWSGTSRSRSSMWMRPRNVSSAPANRLTLPSIASIRSLVWVVSSATLSMTLTRSSSTASRLLCSSVKSEAI